MKKGYNLHYFLSVPTVYDSEKMGIQDLQLFGSVEKKCHGIHIPIMMVLLAWLEKNTKSTSS